MKKVWYTFTLDDGTKGSGVATLNGNPSLRQIREALHEEIKRQSGSNPVEVEITSLNAPPKDGTYPATPDEKAELVILFSREVPDGLYIGCKFNGKYIAQSTMFHHGDQREGRACVKQMVDALIKAGVVEIDTTQLPDYLVPDLA